MSVQGEGTDLKWGITCITAFMILVYALFFIGVKYGYPRGRDCVSPMGRYIIKMGHSLLVKNEIEFKHENYFS